MREIELIDRNTPYEKLPQYLTVEEVGVWLAVSRTTAYELADRIGVRFGRLIRVHRESLKPHSVSEPRAVTVGSVTFTSDDREVSDGR